MTGVAQPLPVAPALGVGGLLAALCTELAAGERSGVVVVTAGLPDDLAGTQIDVDMNSTAVVEADQVRVEQMPIALARDVLAILDTTTVADQPVAPATHPEPWANEMNEGGTCHQSTDQGHADPDFADTGGPINAHSLASTEPPRPQNRPSGRAPEGSTACLRCTPDDLAIHRRHDRAGT